MKTYKHKTHVNRAIDILFSN